MEVYFADKTATQDGVNEGTAGASLWTSTARRLKDDPSLTPSGSLSSQVNPPCGARTTSQTDHDNHSEQAPRLTCHSLSCGFCHCLCRINRHKQWHR